MKIKGNPVYTGEIGGRIMKFVKGILAVFLIASTFFTQIPAAGALAADEDVTTGGIVVTELVIEPAETTVGRTVTIKATIDNNGAVEDTYTASLMIDGKPENQQDVTLAPGQTQIIEFSYIPSSEGNHTISIGDQTSVLKVTLNDSEAKFREGPVVKLRPVTDQIDSSRDGLVELFFSNPSLNDVTLQVDVYVSVPSGIHVYGEGFGLAEAAGTVYGQFTVPPGTARTIYLNIKADKTTEGKDYFIHFSGQYWPEGNKDAYNPISLTHSFSVLEASPNPTDAGLTDPKQIGDSVLGGIWPGWWVIIAVVVLGGIATIVAVRSRKTEVSIEK